MYKSKINSIRSREKKTTPSSLTPASSSDSSSGSSADSWPKRHTIPGVEVDSLYFLGIIVDEGFKGELTEREKEFFIDTLGDFFDSRRIFCVKSIYSLVGDLRDGLIENYMKNASGNEEDIEKFKGWINRYISNEYMLNTLIKYNEVLKKNLTESEKEEFLKNDLNILIYVGDIVVDYLSEIPGSVFYGI